MRRRTLDAAHIADLLARLVEKSLVATDEGSSRERRYRLLETVRLYAGDRLDDAGETRRVADRHAAVGARAGRRSSAARRGLTVTPRTYVRRFDTLLDRAPADALRFCIALLPFWMRRIDLHEARRRLDQALAAARERTALRAQALLAAAAIYFRSGDPRSGARLRQGELRRRVRDRRRRAQWRALQYLGEFGLAQRCGRRRDAVARARPRARATPNASRRPRRRASIRSASFSGCSGIWRAPRSSWRGAATCLRRSRGRRSRSRRRSTSRRRAGPGSDPDCASCSRTRCSRSSRSPATPPSAMSSRTRPGSSRPRRPRAGARAARGERGTVRSVRRRARHGGGARPARISRARRGRARGGPRDARAGARAPAATGRPARRRARAGRARAGRHDRGRVPQRRA